MRSNPAVLLGFFVALIAAMGAAGLAPGGLYVAKHEGDTVHLIEIVLRMVEGQVPHVAFMTPIGFLAAWPMALGIDAGLGVGQAFLWSQVAVAIALLPALTWITLTRFQGVSAYLFGFVTLVLVLAIVHGEAERAVSISMHYNRWAWAVAFLVIAAVMMPGPPGRGAQSVDGVLIGFGIAVLALTKLTYFLAFFPPVLIGLVLARHWTAILAASAAGLAVIAAVTVGYGIAFWSAYFADLMTVATSEGRSAPGDPLDAVIGAPAYFGGSLTLMLGVILLRQAGYAREGLLLLLLAPGFFYVTYQNFGNDPQWLLLLGALLLGLRPKEPVDSPWGWDLRLAFGVTAAIALALEAPSLFNKAYSPFRHAALDRATYTQLLPREGRHGDVFVPTRRAFRVNAQTPLDGEDTMFGAERADRDPTVPFLGETFPNCEIKSGLVAYFDTVARDLEAAGFGGSQIFVADVYASFWLFGDLAPPENGAPWYYGGLPGFAAADYLLVPLCPLVPKIRGNILELISADVEAGLALEEVHRTDLYVLYARDG